MSIQKVVLGLAMAAGLAAAALAIAGDKNTASHNMMACGAGSESKDCPMGKDSSNRHMGQPLTVAAVASVAGGTLADKEKSSVAGALKHHQALVQKANAELVTSVSKSLNLDADQKKQLQCTVEMSTGCTTCKDSCDMNGAGAGSSCSMSGQHGMKKSCPMSGKPS